MHTGPLRAGTARAPLGKSAPGPAAKALPLRFVAVKSSASWLQPDFRSRTEKCWPVPGSRRLRRVVFGVAPKTSSHKIPRTGKFETSVGRKFGRDARTRTPEACAPDSYIGVRLQFPTALAGRKMAGEKCSALMFLPVIILSARRFCGQVTSSGLLGGSTATPTGCYFGFGD